MIEQLLYCEKGSNLNAGVRWDFVLTKVIVCKTSNFSSYLMGKTTTGGGAIAYDYTLSTDTEIKCMWTNYNGAAALVLPKLTLLVKGY